VTSSSPRYDREGDGKEPRVRAAHQPPNVRGKVPGQSHHDRPPSLRRMLSHVDRDDRSPPAYRAADLHGDLVSKLNGALRPHAFSRRERRCSRRCCHLPSSQTVPKATPYRIPKPPSHSRRIWVMTSIPHIPSCIRGSSVRTAAPQSCAAWAAPRSRYTVHDKC
jgi:hypothetical protein